VPHGTLLKYQRVEPGLTGGGPTFRILYASRSVTGAPIAVSGWVHLPAPSSRPAPILAWAHGTTGMADACAPSKGLRYLGPAVPLVDDGMAIVATDYEGLGTPGLHPYLVGPSEGRSVLDAVLAARHLPGAHLSEDVVIWGHSQGGHAAAFAHELAPSWTPELHVRGTVAIAPPASMSHLWFAAASSGRALLAIMTLAGIHAAHPDAALDRILSPEALGRLGVLDRRCSPALAGAMAGMRRPLVADPAKVEPWARYLEESEPGSKTAPDPVLIVHGGSDTTVPPGLSHVLAERWCAKGQVVQRWVQPGATHSSVLDLFPQMRQWTLDRLAGRPVDNGCGNLDAAPPPS
jgi:pimeloyl-ACP methyl ester carboxylesterase